MLILMWMLIKQGIKEGERVHWVRYKKRNSHQLFFINVILHINIHIDININTKTIGPKMLKT